MLAAACGGITDPEVIPVHLLPAPDQSAAVEPEAKATGANADSSARPIPIREIEANAPGLAPTDSTESETPGNVMASQSPETALAGSDAADLTTPDLTKDARETAEAATVPDTSSGASPLPAVATVAEPTYAIAPAVEEVDLRALFAQAMASPDLMRCLGSSVGMENLMQLAKRAPTNEEKGLIRSCFIKGDVEGDFANAATLTKPVSVEASTPSLLEQGLGSPGLMWCLGSNLGIETLLQFNERAPTASERVMAQMCVFDRREIAAWNAEWPKRVDAAFSSTECVNLVEPDYPASYYQGPLIDSHLHIPQLPDDGIGGSADDGYEAPRGAESALYDTIPEELNPLLGRTVTVDEIACSLKNEGTSKAFAFFPVFPEITSPAIDVANRAVEKYPTLFVPFIQASANGVSTLEGTSLEVMLGVRPDFFFGFGEVGDSPTEPINPPPDSEIYTGDFEVARDHGLAVYYHTGDGHQENMARALEQFPEVTFIVHGDFVRPHIDGLMDRYPNIYFTFNDIFDKNIPLFRFGDKADFLWAMDRDWDLMIDAAIDMYKPIIEAHPDRYMWGTDRGDIAWNYDVEVGRKLVEFGRAFIGRFDTEVQEMIAYKNAEALMEKFKK